MNLTYLSVVLALAAIPQAFAATSPGDISAYLSAHNTVRAKHGATALTWSETLATAAQKWASGCVFQHSGGSLGPYGGNTTHSTHSEPMLIITLENLAAGTGSYSIASGVSAWTNEASEYNPSNPGKFFFHFCNACAKPSHSPLSFHPGCLEKYYTGRLRVAYLPCWVYLRRKLRSKFTRFVRPLFANLMFIDCKLHCLRIFTCG